MTRLIGEQGPLRALVEPTLEDLGFTLVRLLLMGKQRRILQIMAERHDGDPITVEDCAAISRSLSAVLDVADPIQGTYDLEVSSPGMDRPLTRREDFARFAGFEARFESDLAVDGRRRVKGRLKGITDDDTVIVAPAEPGPDGSRADWAVPLAALVKAKLVLTDELIHHAMKADKSARNGDAPQTVTDESGTDESGTDESGTDES